MVFQVYMYFLISTLELLKILIIIDFLGFIIFAKKNAPVSSRLVCWRNQSKIMRG